MPQEKTEVLKISIGGEFNIEVEVPILSEEEKQTNIEYNRAKLPKLAQKMDAIKKKKASE